MDMTHTYWEENSNLQRVKYENCNGSDENSRLKDERSLYTCCETNLNFSTANCSEDDSEYGSYKNKNKVTRQDPMSHRIIEKRRRDRMNNCLADLSRLIPTEYLKKGRGRIEKTEIIEMAIKHMKYLQQEHGNPSEHYRLGYQECMSETMRFMVEVEGHFPREGICVRLLNHLQKHCETLLHAPHVVQQSAPPERHIIHSVQRDAKNNMPLLSDYNSKCDHESAIINSNNNNSNNMDNHVSNDTYTVTSLLMNHNNNNTSDSDTYDKHLDCNGVSYKYKNSIKMRFNQDLNAGHERVKRSKLDSDDRRNSITSIENHSSSHSSPPSSEICTRISDNDNTNRSSPAESTFSMNNNVSNMKLEPVPRHDSLQPFNSIVKNPAHNPDIKTNFSIPIFVLHAKGSYYVPLTIDYKTLLPYLRNYNILEVLPAVNNIILHPVTINVNFQPTFPTRSCSSSNGLTNSSNGLSNNSSSLSNGLSNGVSNGGKYKSEYPSTWH